MPPRRAKGTKVAAAPKAKPAFKTKRSQEEGFLKQVRAAGLPEPERELRFHVPKAGEKKRQWRFDFAWTDLRVAVEVDGGVWGRRCRCCARCRARIAGRHTDPAGFEKDCEKLGTAFAQGWDVLRITSKMVKNELGISLLQERFQVKGLVEREAA